MLLAYLDFEKHKYHNIRWLLGTCSCSMFTPWSSEHVFSVFFGATSPKSAMQTIRRAEEFVFLFWKASDFNWLWNIPKIIAIWKHSISISYFQLPSEHFSKLCKTKGFALATWNAGPLWERLAPPRFRGSPRAYVMLVSRPVKTPV